MTRVFRSCPRRYSSEYGQTRPSTRPKDVLPKHMESGISGNAAFSGAQGAVNQFESFLGTQAHVISNFPKVVNSPGWLPNRKTYESERFWRLHLSSLALCRAPTALPTSRRAERRVCRLSRSPRAPTTDGCREAGRLRPVTGRTPGSGDRSRSSERRRDRSSPVPRTCCPDSTRSWPGRTGRWHLAG